MASAKRLAASSVAARRAGIHLTLEPLCVLGCLTQCVLGALVDLLRDAVARIERVEAFEGGAKLDAKLCSGRSRVRYNFKDWLHVIKVLV